MARQFKTLITVCVLAATPSLSNAYAADKPITSREPDAESIAKTPITDLNLSRTEIPALLVEAETRPYALTNIETCKQLIAAVEELDTILGPDIDLPRAERNRVSSGRLAQWAVGTFIPFRTLIREFSGANRQQREIADAIQAGVARRGFLKGIGTARRCPYPASPATEAIIARHAAAIAKEDADKRDGSAKSSKSRSDQKTDERPATPQSTTSEIASGRKTPIFTSEPVIQPTR